MANKPHKATVLPSSARPKLPLYAWIEENPKRAARVVLGTLLGLNLLGAILLLEPFGGSPEGLEATRSRMESELRQKRLTLGGVAQLASKMQSGEAAGGKFVETYFLEQRRASSEILQTLDTMERKIGIRARGKTFGVEAIEGTTDYVLLTISANYDGSYADLVEFCNGIDRAERLLILDSLQVAPQQDGVNLHIQAQLYAFVRQNNATPEDSPTEVAQANVDAGGNQSEEARENQP